jgi:hypothetical protein
MTFARLVVGDKNGTILDELEADILFANWRINKIGKCEFKIAAIDPKAIESNLKYGNRIFIDFENGLPDWGGIIDPPRAWDDGMIKVAAYSGEYLFKDRTTDKGRYFTNQTVGAIYEALILDANDVAATGVTIGSVYSGGKSHSPDYHFKGLLDIFQKSLVGRLSAFDFDMTPYLDAGKIKFLANLYEARGSTKTNIALIQGKNLGKVKLKEQGTIINSQVAAGEGTGWGNERLTANAQDIVSIDEYGLREGAKIYGDVSIQATLDDHVDTSLAKSKDAFNIWTLEALDADPAGFASYEHGDIVALTAPDYGFGGTETTIRIMSREFEPGPGVCNLVVQEET